MPSTAIEGFAKWGRLRVVGNGERGNRDCAKVLVKRMSELKRTEFERIIIESFSMHGDKVRLNLLRYEVTPEHIFSSQCKRVCACVFVWWEWERNVLEFPHKAPHNSTLVHVSRWGVAIERGAERRRVLHFDAYRKTLPFTRYRSDKLRKTWQRSEQKHPMMKKF